MGLLSPPSVFPFSLSLAQPPLFPPPVVFLYAGGFSFGCFFLEYAFRSFHQRFLRRFLPLLTCSRSPRTSFVPPRLSLALCLLPTASRMTRFVVSCKVSLSRCRRVLCASRSRLDLPENCAFGAWSSDQSIFFFCRILLHPALVVSVDFPGVLRR